MPNYAIARIHEDGQDVIIVPLPPSFGHKPEREQNAEIAELQARAVAAGIPGPAVPVWETDDEHMAFIAPEQWHPFFRSIDMHWVTVNLNAELSW
jgi:hypothetical protein